MKTKKKTKSFVCRYRMQLACTNLGMADKCSIEPGNDDTCKKFEASGHISQYNRNPNLR